MEDTPGLQVTHKRIFKGSSVTPPVMSSLSVPEASLASDNPRWTSSVHIDIAEACQPRAIYTLSEVFLFLVPISPPIV